MATLTFIFTFSLVALANDRAFVRVHSYTKCMDRRDWVNKS